MLPFLCWLTGCVLDDPVFCQTNHRKQKYKNGVAFNLVSPPPLLLPILLTLWWTTVTICLWANQPVAIVLHSPVQHHHLHSGDSQSSAACHIRSSGCWCIPSEFSSFLSYTIFNGCLFCSLNYMWLLFLWKFLGTWYCQPVAWSYLYHASILFLTYLHFVVIYKHSMLSLFLFYKLILCHISNQFGLPYWLCLALGFVQVQLRSHLLSDKTQGHIWISTQLKITIVNPRASRANPQSDSDLSQGSINCSLPQAK